MSSFTINRVVIVGRLTRDPELRALPSGQSVCGLRVACSGSRRGADGEYQDRPNYFDVSAFGLQGENINRYTRRGSLLAIDGRLEWREWETAEQQRREAVSIVAETVQFLDSPAGGGGAGIDRDGGDGIDRDGGAGDGEAQQGERAQESQRPERDGDARAAETLVF